MLLLIIESIPDTARIDSVALTGSSSRRVDSADQPSLF